jgi:Xaa-Pro aminopeptidase
MVFSIDIPMFHTPWGGLRAEDGFHVTPEGAVPLQSLPSILDIR